MVYIWGRLGSNKRLCLSLERLKHACWVRGMVWKREILKAQGEGSGVLRCRILSEEVKEARTEQGRCWQGEGFSHLLGSLSWGPGRPWAIIFISQMIKLRFSQVIGLKASQTLSSRTETDLSLLAPDLGSLVFVTGFSNIHHFRHLLAGRTLAQT